MVSVTSTMCRKLSLFQYYKVIFLSYCGTFGVLVFYWFSFSLLHLEFIFVDVGIKPYLPNRLSIITPLLNINAAFLNYYITDLLHSFCGSLGLLIYSRTQSVLIILAL